MIEAMACGTPVIAWRCGSVPEVIEDGVSGYIVDSIEEGVEAVHRVQWLDRRACRQAFESRFDATRMANDYLNIYRQQLHSGSHQAPKPMRNPALGARNGHPHERPRAVRPHSPLLGSVSAPQETAPNRVDAV